MYWGDVVPPEIWDLRSPPTKDQSPYVGPKYWPPYDEPTIELYPNRYRAIVINEVGNSISEPANFTYREGGPTGDDYIELKASDLVDRPEFRDRFATVPSVRRGKVLTIDLGNRWRGLRFASRIYQGSNHRAFGWKNADSSGKIKVRVPKNCSPGAHKIAVVDRGGRLHGWNKITVTR